MDPSILQHLTEAAAAAEQAGDLPRAAAAYRELAAALPRNAELLQRLGLVEYMLGNPEDAIVPFAASARLDRRNPGFLVNLGLAQHAAGRHAEAAATLRKAIGLKPALSIAHNNLGLALSALGDYKGALASAQRAVALAPRDAQAQYNLGNALYRAGAFDRAVDAYRVALDQGGARAEVFYNLGNAQRSLHSADAAIHSYRQALALDPAHAPALINLGNLLMAARDYDGAEQAFRQVVELGDDPARQAAGIDRLRVEARYNLANIQRMTGRLGLAIESYRAVLAQQPMHELACSNLLLTMNYSAEVSREESFAAHCEYGRRFAPSVAAPVSVPRPAGPSAAAAPAVLRIGFVSADFRRHAAAMFIEPLIERLPAHGFEVFCYYNHDSADEVTERLRSKAAGWRDIHSIDDDAVAAQIRQDRIDLLVDLAGHTAGHRLRVFARRPGPVQLTMIGHVNTTGVEAIDYRITDAITEPAEPASDGRDHDRWYTEKLIRLPHTCWCMRPFDPPGPVADARVPPGVPFTFGSFNNFAKLSDGTLELWTALLRSLPATRLLMVTVPEGSTQALLRARFERGGVDPSRLDLHGLVPGDRYRALHGLVDLALDPFPCNGATTTLETLWLGVPVLALEGDSFRSRNGASILRNAGLDALVARSEDDYLAIARRLAAEPAQLVPLRAHLGERLRDTPLMDEAAFAGDLAEALRAAWAGRAATASPR